MQFSAATLETQIKSQTPMFVARALRDNKVDCCLQVKDKVIPTLKIKYYT